jgi:hypothetical protein
MGWPAANASSSAARRRTEVSIGTEPRLVTLFGHAAQVSTLQGLIQEEVCLPALAPLRQCDNILPANKYSTDINILLSIAYCQFEMRQCDNILLAVQQQGPIAAPAPLFGSLYRAPLPSD